MDSGFRSYHIYNVVKYMHFRSKKYDISKNPLAKTSIFLKKWNDEMVNRPDSLAFYKLDKLYDNKKLIRLFSYYFLRNQNFYVFDIIDDEFQLFKKYERELITLKDTLELDFLRIYHLAVKNKKSMREILFSKKGIPLVFKIFDRKKISVHTLLALHLVWGIGDKINIDNLNIVEEEKYKVYRMIFDKYHNIVYKYFNFDMKNVFKNSIKYLNKESKNEEI